ncbi:uncharacterized protein LOC123321081 [Coccinella septempunctata]|uniref:uncharacterized protein LOC123321081 n=1 Tax=Coccinella septempunctata TaxID=41139 RepID=UPI001D0813A1|nr:uncharacterized protein LOC123321081 [Coccinella septempunctata]
MSPMKIFRCKEYLKRCYENKKKEVKKLVATQKRNCMATGGGGAMKIDDPCAEIVMEITNKKTLMGMECEFGEDRAGPSRESELEEGEVVTIHPEELENQEEESIDWSHHTAQNLRIPLSKELSETKRLCEKSGKWISRRRPGVVKAVHTKMDIEALISSIFVKSALWDSRDAQHRNRYVLDKLWDDVANEMKLTIMIQLPNICKIKKSLNAILTKFFIPENVVRTKWKNLRDTFRKELKKMPVKRSGDGASSWRSSWPYFDNLYFLKDQFTARKSTSNLPDGEIFDEDLNSQLSNEEILDNVDPPSMVDISQSCINEPSTSTPSVSNFSRKRESDHNDCHTPLEEKIKLLSNQKKPPDEDECFFESLLPHIRTLSPRKKMLLRMNIQKEVYDCVYGGQQRTQSTSSVQNTPEEYSTSTSIASYINHFSDESFQNL